MKLLPENEITASLASARVYAHLCQVTWARSAASGGRGTLRTNDGTASQWDNLHFPGLGER